MRREGKPTLRGPGDLLHVGVVVVVGVPVAELSDYPDGLDGVLGASGSPVISPSTNTIFGVTSNLDNATGG